MANRNTGNTVHNRHKYGRGNKWTIFITKYNIYIYMIAKSSPKTNPYTKALVCKGTCKAQAGLPSADQKKRDEID